MVTRHMAVIISKFVQVSNQISVHPVPSLHGKWMEKKWKQWQTILGGSKITVDIDCSLEIKRRLLLGRKTMTNLDGVLKSRDITLHTKVPTVKAMFFSNSHVRMWELDHKKGCSLVPLPFLSPACTSQSSWFTYCWDQREGFSVLSC